jgi:hypothetical protein
MDFRFLNLGKHRVTSALLLGSAILFLETLPCGAQDMGAGPIRVESNEVLVPVVVIDKGRQAQLQRETPNLVKQALDKKDLVILDQSVAEIAIPDLAAKEIHLFEDGVEQSIVNATFEPEPYWNVKDNLGYHSEFIGRGDGRWSGPQWPESRIAEIAVPHYLVAYSPPPSADGSCHLVSVNVDRPNAIVNARNAYCNIKHPPSDPLLDTGLGKQMEQHLSSVTMDNIGLALFAAPFYTGKDHARVHIAVDISWHLSTASSKGILGMIYKEDGSLALRFSDLYDLEDAPQRFETQVDLPPGEYTIKVVLSDGKDFGRAQSKMIVGNNITKALALSTIAICRRTQEAHTSSFRGKMASASLVSTNYVPLISKKVEYKPTGNTRFESLESFDVYFEIYEPLVNGRSAAQVTIAMKIVDVGTGGVTMDLPSLNVAPFEVASNPVICIGRKVDTKKLPIGAYELEIQAIDSKGRRTAWQKASFTIEKQRRAKT